MNKEFNQKIADIKGEMERLGTSLSDLAGYDASDLKEDSEEVIRQAKAHLQQASKITRQKAEEVNDFVMDNPWTTVAIASAVGFVLGLISTKTKSRRQ